MGIRIAILLGYMFVKDLLLSSCIILFIPANLVVREYHVIFTCLRNMVNPGYTSLVVFIS